MPRYQMAYFVLEEDLLGDIKDSKANYLLVAIKEQFLRLYLDSAPGQIQCIKMMKL